MGWQMGVLLLLLTALPMAGGAQAAGDADPARPVQRCGSTQIAPDWQRFCRVMRELLSDRRPAVLGWTVPRAGDRHAGQAPHSLIEIHAQPMATTAKVVLRDIEMSIDGIGRVIAAADETVPPAFRTIDLELPAIFPDECPARPAGEADLASVEIKRALVLRFSTPSRDAYRLRHCPPDGAEPTARPAAPTLFIRAVTFKQATRWLLPPEPHVSLAFAASRFEGPLEIASTATSSAMVTAASARGSTYIALHTSVLDAHASIYGISIDELSAYFNRMQSFELINVAVAERLKISDNAIGPLRIRGLPQPREFLVDANTLSDSLYIEEVQPDGRRGQDGPPLWLVAHNKITGNLKLSVVPPQGHLQERGGGAAPHRPAFRFMGMRIDGSAYLLVHQELIRRALPIELDLTHSTIASRLLVSAVAEVDSDSAVGARQSLGAIEPHETAAACDARAGPGRGRLRVDLTSSTAGALVWNLPLDGTGSARCVGWSGPSFRPSTLDARPVSGPLLVENGTNRSIDWFAQATQISNWPQAQVNPSPEAFGFTERYFLERGFLFEALSMKGLKTRENLTRKWNDTISDLMDGELSSIIRLLVLSVLFVYYAPANFGANPEWALGLLAMVWFLSWGFYARHARNWSVAEWHDYREQWDAAGKRPYLSEERGFEQKDAHPWRTLRRWLYALDSMVPLVRLGVADEYQPHVQGKAAGSHITILPPAQKVVGTWLGSLCLVIFLF